MRCHGGGSTVRRRRLAILVAGIALVLPGALARSGHAASNNATTSTRPRATREVHEGIAWLPAVARSHTVKAPRHQTLDAALAAAVVLFGLTFVLVRPRVRSGAHCPAVPSFRRRGPPLPGLVS